MKKNAIYNPHNKLEDELPTIFGFNKGGHPGWYTAVLLAEDGTYLGGYVCSHKASMPHDLGIEKRSRLDRHEEKFKPHYPEGYKMEFVSAHDPRLLKVFKLNQQLRKKDEETSE